jgi:uncharacterized RmlC-like cupin family protein
MFSRWPTLRRRPFLSIGVGMTAALIASALLAHAQDAPSGGEQRLTPDEFDFSTAGKGGTGTSGVQGIRTLVLNGDPKGTGLYTILLSVPAHTKIAAHNHPDERVATVISGVWRIGYGSAFDESRLKALPPGSFYTEPAGDMHFAETQDSAVVVQITGYGPSGTIYNSDITPDK